MAEDPTPTVTPAKASPNWAAGIRAPVQPSLRDILSQQSREKEITAAEQTKATLKTPSSGQRMSDDGRLVFP